MAKLKFAMPKKWRIPEIVDTAMWEFSVAANVLAQGLEQQEFMLGDRFTGADTLIAHTLPWARNFDVPLGHDALEKYTTRLLARPALERTLAREAAA